MQSLLALNMLLAGCSSLFDESGESDNTDNNELKDDTTSISRSLGTPELIGFDNCEDLGSSIKETIFQEYEVQLQQSVEEVYNYWGGGFVDDAVMMEWCNGTCRGSAGRAARGWCRRRWRRSWCSDGAVMAQ